LAQAISAERAAAMEADRHGFGSCGCDLPTLLGGHEAMVKHTISMDSTVKQTTSMDSTEKVASRTQSCKPSIADSKPSMTEVDSFADFTIIGAGEDEDCDNDLVKVGRRCTDSEKEILRAYKRCWTRQQKELQDQSRTRELQMLLERSRENMRTQLPRIGALPANRYGEDVILPPFEAGAHVPVLALLNPFSGALVGTDILAIARKSAYYQDRFFNIVDVVKDQRRGGIMDIFRTELCKAKDEAKKMGTRPRIISGGGDGTASFALFIIFAALRADAAREDDGLGDKGNGFIWTDEEMAESFPALAQMPLGSANDFGNALGWGSSYPGHAESGMSFHWRKHAFSALKDWLGAVLSPASRLANFDVYGIVPTEGSESCDFKLCELTGRRGLTPKVWIDGERHLVMKEANLPVPLFLCLYFSAGFGAYMTARFQINRRKKPLQNKLEYARQAAGILLESIPPQLNVGLEGVKVCCGQDAYFPPRSSDGSGGRKYREVGFLNINWQAGMVNGAERAPPCGRIFSTRAPAKFNDGMMDMYRLKLASIFRNPGFKYQTDKREEGLTLEHTGGKGKGVFFQWDGESRFAFSPTGDAFHIHIRKILNIPVVLGPRYAPDVTGDPDNGQAVHFGFAGSTPQDQATFRQRIIKGVCGELNAELIASRADMMNAGLKVDHDEKL